ncbi:MAG: demethoxyubiquinone hydroxylase family protein [Planctomycetota bacterium]
MPPHPTRSRQLLIALLRLAYSGELAAAHAYRGHAASVADAGEKDRIRVIEEEEWHHRRLVGEMLSDLDARPSRAREWRAMVVGRALGLACRISGWFAPMYGAGRLESRNVREYETAARLAHDAGCDGFVDCLLTMAEVEWEHERYFRSKAQSHPFSRWVRLWPAPPPKGSIRASARASDVLADSPTSPAESLQGS